MKRKLGKAADFVFGGAALVKGTDVLAHAQNPTALAGDISGLAGVGIAAGMGRAVMGIALGGRKRRKRK